MSKPSSSESPSIGFDHALRASEALYSLSLNEEERAYLKNYFRQVMVWNTRLHLVAPCAPEEFAVRHVLESLAALPFIRQGAQVIDVGSGAGLPIIPCLIVRSDLRATLIEASAKKGVFLSETIRRLNIRDRADVMTARFELITTPEGQYVTCRALDRFTELFPKLLAWSPPASTLVLFGGPALQTEIEKTRLGYESLLLPGSDQRFLFVINRN